jgi:hypothetical protein
MNRTGKKHSALLVYLALLLWEIIEHVNLLFCSADKSRLKRKLDMDPEFGYAE